jgi:hypothetical protein
MLVCLISCGDTDVVEKDGPGLDRFAGPHFGLVAPTDEPEVLLPGLVSTAEDERCVTFLDSGRVCLVTTDNGGTWFTAMKDHRWSDPEPFPFNYADDMLDYTAGPGGRTLVFMTSRPVDEDDPGTTHHLWMVEWTGDGWADPVPLPAPEKIEGLGSGYPAIAADGTIYFISDARDGATEGGIFQCRTEDGQYLPAELVEHPVNTPYIDFDPTVAPDHSYLIFASNRPGGFGLWDHYVVFREADGGWSPAINLGREFNTEYSEACPNVTPDGKLFIFASSRTSNFLLDPDSKPIATGRDVYWADTGVVESLRHRFAGTSSSAETVRQVLEDGGLGAAVAVLEDLHTNHHSEYSFTPNELLEVCAELLAAGDASGADGFFRALVRVLPEKDRIELGYAAICALFGRLESSEKLIGELRSGNPDFNLEYAVLNIGVHLNRASKTDDEIATYEAYLDELPESYRLRFYLAAAYERRGDPALALEICRQALELSPEHPYLIEMMNSLQQNLDTEESR